VFLMQEVPFYNPTSMDIRLVVMGRFLQSVYSHRLADVSRKR
jgi:hypothetical protein